MERVVTTSEITLDLLQFEERDFYWEVAPVDKPLSTRRLAFQTGTCQNYRRTAGKEKCPETTGFEHKILDS